MHIQQNEQRVFVETANNQQSFLNKTQDSQPSQYSHAHYPTSHQNRFTRTDVDTLQPDNHSHFRPKSQTQTLSNHSNLAMQISNHRFQQPSIQNKLSQQNERQTNDSHSPMHKNSLDNKYVFNPDYVDDPHQNKAFQDNHVDPMEFRRNTSPYHHNPQSIPFRNNTVHGQAEHNLDLQQDSNRGISHTINNCQQQSHPSFNVSVRDQSGSRFNTIQHNPHRMQDAKFLREQEGQGHDLSKHRAISTAQFSKKISQNGLGTYQSSSASKYSQSFGGHQSSPSQNPLDQQAQDLYPINDQPESHLSQSQARQSTDYRNPDNPSNDFQRNESSLSNNRLQHQSDIPLEHVPKTHRFNQNYPQLEVERRATVGHSPNHSKQSPVRNNTFNTKEPDKFKQPSGQIQSNSPKIDSEKQIYEERKQTSQRRITNQQSQNSNNDFSKKQSFGSQKSLNHKTSNMSVSIDASFFDHLIVNELRNAEPLIPALDQNLAVIEEFLDKNRLTALVDHIIYNIEDDLFVVQFNRRASQTLAFQKNQTVDENALLLRKFRLISLEGYPEEGISNFLKRRMFIRPSFLQK